MIVQNFIPACTKKLSGDRFVVGFVKVIADSDGLNIGGVNLRCINFEEQWKMVRRYLHERSWRLDYGRCTARERDKT